MERDLIRLLAAWALVHETADEGWKAAVERGRKLSPGEMAVGPEAFVDGLSAMVAEEMKRLKVDIAEGRARAPGEREPSPELEELRFEVGELRGRLESMQASLDAILARLDARG